ncbi:MATH domain-containing protein [uncultured Prochlorococcus sp.]|jgi:DNA primase catalytic subunit|uniref:MATH domain-containing protein n=1 Tax=Prochlorococcus sp. TaxID=1220 RepID=UPI00002F4F83|nr:MATH domain-containing protein [uncultured Prochlorococcus sp.]RCL49802.1 MAG: MATH domain-containing protein [Prochlorococcus sp. MED-G72]|tara:strand:+ start:1146 stop:1460 length:315 start_codon:yes stop_codon:yes gene_type:complete
MSESNNLPQAISHKKLTYLMLNAQKDLNASDDKKNTESLEKQEFDELINNWENVTKDVIKTISKRNKNLLKDKSSNSLIALGAMEVHLNMALQALNAFQKDSLE